MALNRSIIEKFKKSFEAKCYRLIVDAYHISIKEKVVHLSWDENDISSELQKHMKANPNRIQWRISTSVESHIPTSIPKIKGFAAKFPRIDFKMSTFGLNLEFEYFFEAKNLKEKSSKLKRRYINTGIDNFINKKYENGSMVGYLLEGDCSKTIAGINSLLKKDSRSSESLVAETNAFFNPYYESKHSPALNKLKHLIFDFASLLN